MMNKPIRILHVIRLMNHGGVENMIMNLYRNIDRTKVQFDFVQNSNEPAVFDEEILALGGRIYRCPHYNGINHFAYTKWWHEFFKSHAGEYPIVHGHLGSTASIYLSIAKKYRSYALAHSHNTGANWIYKLFSYSTRFIADDFFACSRDAAISRYGKRIGNNEECCTILKNAINTKQFIYDEEIRKDVRLALNVSDSTLVVGHVGQFREQKNHKFLLEIFQQVNKILPNSVLLLVGDGPLRPQIDAEIVKKGLQDKIILAGARNDVWKYYQAMDVFVLPSHYEGLGIVCIEAQTASLPCLVSDTIPDEAMVTKLIRRLSLEKGAEYWAHEITSSLNDNRENMLQDICDAGYDISTTAAWLTEYYINVVKKYGK